ncbi:MULTISPECIES: helix-turn-helix domain-containing protein [unclassified Caballeronia]|uniref:helix-turn-helix domain-containing protein n=1 Tax=unclassified Caballeronia TaxID=2646786 RepID=UPI00285C1564|nr:MULTISPECIES: helix-turn-helix domain-containing protein [unclassified Caballeronia]MDR5772476.1 helix-turn-helix domain-containing protein [Caballeronia sp. LZ002]MDR5847910.1 helix-turn-helix domain-containing protein [Caballeronia sp. LZ003]
MIQPPHDLLDLVIDAIEGEEVDKQTSMVDGVEQTVELRWFGPEKWIYRVHERGILSPLQFLAIVDFVLNDWYDPEQDERLLIDGWFRVLMEAAQQRIIVPRNRHSLLPLDSIDDWNGWLLSVTDANAFIASLGMKWTFTEAAAHLFAEGSNPSGVQFDLIGPTSDKHGSDNEPESPKFENPYSPKLTAEQRAEIVRRVNDGETHKALAAEFGVTPQSISKTVARANERTRGGATSHRMPIRVFSSMGVNGA